MTERTTYPDKIVERFLKKVQKTDSCWIWTGASDYTRGYGTAYDGKKMRLAHRLSWEMFVGSLQDGLCVCHHCDNPSCVNPAHLFLASHSENMKDAYRKGRLPVKKNCKINQETADEIRKVYAAGEKSLYALAVSFGISSTQVRRIVLEDAWT